MKPLEMKTKFAEMRSEGKSFQAISKELGIATGTCSDWDKELKTQIDTLKADKMSELYTTYGMGREARIERLGKRLLQIDGALDSCDLSKMPPDKLLDLYLKYQETLSKEYVAPKKEIEQKATTKETLISALADIVDRIRSGELSPEQAKNETMAISNLLKAVDTFHIEESKDNVMQFEFVTGEYEKAFTDENGETFYKKRLVTTKTVGGTRQ